YHATRGAEPVRDISRHRHERRPGDSCRHAVADDPAQLPDGDHLHPGDLAGTAELAGHVSLVETSLSFFARLMPGFFSSGGMSDSEGRPGKMIAPHALRGRAAHDAHWVQEREEPSEQYGGAQLLVGIRVPAHPPAGGGTSPSMTAGRSG